VSTGVKIENFIRIKTKNNMKKIIGVYLNGYSIAFKKEKTASRSINN